MANHKSAIKRIRINERQRIRNRLVVSATRTEIRQARIAITKGDQNEAATKVIEAISALDKAAAKGVIHKNNAARRKSRLMLQLNALRGEAAK